MATEPRTTPTPAGPPGPAGGAQVTRSEERLQVGTTVRVSGRAVLRRYLVTETVTQTFQVRREEVRLEENPAANEDPRSAPPRTPFSGGVAAEMVLHREVPEVVMRVVPAERVRLHVDTVTERVTIADTVRREQIAVDHTTEPGRSQP